MNITITTNCDAVAGLLGHKGADVGIAAAKSVRAAAKAIYDIDRKEVNVIYARAIPRRKSGKPMWKRKGTLRRGEALTFPNPLLGFISNDTPYTASRHALNRPGAGGVTRHDPWRTLTVGKAEGKAKDAFQAAFEAAFK